MPIEAEISSITGFNLVESIELATFVAVGIAVISLIVTALKTRKQTKIDSAQLSLELIKRVREKDFAEIIDKIFDEKSKDCDNITLERLLNHFDMIAKFEEDGIIEIDHIIQIYGGLLRKIKTDSHIQLLLKKDEKLFRPLINLYCKV